MKNRRLEFKTPQKSIQLVIASANLTARCAEKSLISSLLKLHYGVNPQALVVIAEKYNV